MKASSAYMSRLHAWPIRITCVASASACWHGPVQSLASLRPPTSPSSFASPASLTSFVCPYSMSHRCPCIALPRVLRIPCPPCPPPPQVLPPRAPRRRRSLNLIHSELEALWNSDKMPAGAENTRLPEAMGQAQKRQYHRFKSGESLPTNWNSDNDPTPQPSRQTRGCATAAGRITWRDQSVAQLPWEALLEHRPRAVAAAEYAYDPKRTSNERG